MWTTPITWCARSTLGKVRRGKGRNHAPRHTHDPFSCYRLTPLPSPPTYIPSVSVSPIYNVSLFSANGMTESEIDESEIDQLPVKGYYSKVTIPFNTTTTGTPLTVSDISLNVSTNEHLFTTSDTWSVEENTDIVTGDPKAQNWKLTLTPEPFAVGSTTLKFNVGDASTR